MTASTKNEDTMVIAIIAAVYYHFYVLFLFVERTLKVLIYRRYLLTLYYGTTVLDITPGTVDNYDAYRRSRL